MELYDVMRTTATTRLYDLERDVDDALLQRVLDAARFAPNGGNRQAWHVIVVRDVRLRARLAELYRGPWERYLAEHHGRAVPAEPETPVDRFVASLDRVPVHLVFCALLPALALTDAALDRPGIVGGASIYPFVQNVLLGCRAEGLGATMTTMVVANEPAVKELLGIPDDYALACHVPVGWPALPHPRRLRRADVTAFTSRDSFGTAFVPAAAAGQSPSSSHSSVASFQEKRSSSAT